MRRKMERKKGILSLIAIPALVMGILVVISVSQAFAAGEAKYVFFMIGDGMSMTQRNAAEIYMAATENSDAGIGVKMLNMSKMPAQGMSTTYSSNALITDSAAAGTALASGYKTKSGIVGMDESATIEYPTLAELAKSQGKKVGIISTVDIDHATPACFYAHQPTRNNYYEIALQLAESGFDFFGGGDIKKPTGSKKDRPSAYDAIAKAGYKRVTDRKEFMALKPGSEKIMAVNPRLDGSKAMPYDMDRQNDEITVAEFTAKAIELLDNPNGFFVMVEGGKIDWACHANDAVATIRDTIAFDEAVGVAMNFYREHPDETLVVVTGDHETGGLSIGFAGTRYDSFMGKLSSQKVSFEAWDQLFGEFRDNAGKDVTLDDIMPQITENFGLVKVSAAERRDLEKKADNGDEKASRILGLALKNYEVQQLEKAFARSMASEKERSEDDQTYLQYGGYEPLTVSITHILNQKAGLAWTSYAHTGVPVPVSAIGAGEEMFNGYYDNTDVFSKIANAMGLITEQVAAK